MNATTFIANLDAFGVRITRAGDELRVKTRPGASVDGFIDLIRLNRTGLLAALAGEHESVPWITPDDLHWVHVSQEEVEETVPPPHWDKVQPFCCVWPDLCRVLGPCPHVSDGTCRCQRHKAVAEEKAA